MQRNCIITNSSSNKEGNNGNDYNLLEDFEKTQPPSFGWPDNRPVSLQDGVGYRSPCVSLQQPFQGSTSPAGQGRSVREFEEQMATLRKENFNLKLRLYFIEESIPGYQQASNSSEGQETLMKQLIDVRVEMEILRKEIQEKQDLLKEAAQAMTQMEKIQKDTELRYQEMIDELKQKIQYMEMDREMEKAKSGHVNTESMSDLLGRSEIHENMNALQRIRDLESLLKQSDEKLEDFQQQITKLDEILAKRDETIQEYEEKVKELVFQNAELLESVENRDLELATKERSIKGLRSANAELKSENEKLVLALQSTRDNFGKEMSNIKEYESQMRQQQETLTKMQTTISIKTANTERLLERIQDYEQIVTRMNIERNIVKRENQFFKMMIDKLSAARKNDEELMNHKNNFLPNLNFKFNYLGLSKQKNFETNCCPRRPAKRLEEDVDKQTFNFQQKLCFNICCNRECCRQKKLATNNNCGQVNNSQENDHEPSDSLMETNIPIRYTISDTSLFSQYQNSSKSVKPQCLLCSESKTFYLDRNALLNIPKLNDNRFQWSNNNNEQQQLQQQDGLNCLYSKFGTSFP